MRRCLSCNKQIHTTALRSVCVRCKRQFGQKGANAKTPLFCAESPVVETRFVDGYVVKQLAPADADGSHFSEPPIPLRTVHPLYIPY